MIHPAISYFKSELYEKTQNDISKNKFDDSETVCFTGKDLVKAEWKEEKEFVLNGSSYDVIKITVIKGVKYFYCYLDKKDIVLNSILKFSGFFVTKKVYVWRQFDVPLQGKKLMKISNSFAFIDCEEWRLFSFYLKLKSEYLQRLENVYCLSIVIPPPEEWV
ncbi:hypothetical protein EG348_03875 [Chryseobacterium sp. G0201]|nr:hypothetical protein EG348_03875 [Chryseobacterium sp. G0201]